MNDHDEPVRKLKFDWTISVADVVGMVVLAIGLVFAYTDLKEKNAVQDVEIATIKMQAANDKADIARKLESIDRKLDQIIERELTTGRR